MLITLLWFLPLDFEYGLYLSGADLGGISFLLLGASIWFMYVAWKEIPQLMFLSSLLSLIVVVLLYLQGGLKSIAWGMIIMIILIIANVIASFRKMLMEPES